MNTYDISTYSSMCKISPLSRVWVVIVSNHPIGAGRLELPRALCPTDFKSGVSTDSTMLPYVYSIRYLVMIVK